MYCRFPKHHKIDTIIKYSVLEHDRNDNVKGLLHCFFTFSRNIPN